MATRKLRHTPGAVVAATAVSALLALTACSGGSSGETSSTGESTEGATVSGSLEILVSSASASDAAFEKINEMFTQEYPDVDLTFSSVDNENYPATKSSRLTAGNVDILVAQSMRDVPDYAADSTPDDVLLARAGQLLDLSDQPFMDNYTPTVVEAQSIDGKAYSVPTGLSYSTGVYYNKTLFDELGLTVPTTYSEFQDVVNALEEAGHTAIGIGGRDSWPAGLVMLGSVGSLYPTDADKSALSEKLWNNEVSLTEGTQLQVMEETAWVFEHTASNFAGTGYDEVPALFANRDVAMTFDGTWNNPTILDAVNDAFDVGYFPFPGSDDAADNQYLNGKVELTLAVAANAPNQDAALAWLDFFSQPENYAVFVEAAGYAPAQPDIDTSEFLNSIAQYTTEFHFAWDQIWIANNDAGQDAVFPFNYTAITPMGSMTAEKAAEAAQAAWSAAF